MRHYYIICYEAPNGRILTECAYTTKRFIVHHMTEGIQYKLLAITRISKKQYKALRGEKE